MTVAVHPLGRRASPAVPALRPALASRITAWVAFLLAHLWLGMLNLLGPGQPLGDVVELYKLWVNQGLGANYWVGIDAAWVYPILAMVPMLAASVAGADFYGSGWLSLVLVLDCVAFAALTGWFSSRRRVLIGWWWIAFLVLLGPIALGRIDAITVPLAIVGVLLLATRPRAAATLLAVAAWIKVWPAALVAAVVIASRERRAVVAAAAATSAAVVAVALALGAAANVFSFVTEQTGRGLQIEAPVTTFWMWHAAATADTLVYYDRDILAYQVQGPGVDVAAALMTPVLAVAGMAAITLGLWAARRGAEAAELLAPLALTMVAVLIAVNKVGSPQFMTWLAVPVILGLATRAAGRGVSFRAPAAITLLLAALTQIIYPYLYLDLIALEPAVLAVLTARNLLLFVLLGWAVRAVIRVGRSSAAAAAAHSAARPGEPVSHPQP